MAKKKMARKKSAKKTAKKETSSDVAGPGRKVILGLGISLDGYIARLDGSVDFLFMPKDYSMGPFFKTVDTCILGRKTYDDGLKMGGSFDGSMKTYVFSKTQSPGERNNVTFTSDSPSAIVSEIRKKPGKHIWLMGGGILIRDFLKEDLVDELYVGVVPTLIGEGLPLFPSGFPQREFDLIENKTYSQGLITLRYVRGRKRGSPALTKQSNLRKK
jgi:dihydrofolate reductase